MPNLVHCHRLHYCWIVEIFLVCRENIGGFSTQKVAPKWCEASVPLVLIGPFERDVLMIHVH